MQVILIEINLSLVILIHLSDFEMEMERCECRKEVMEQINYVDLQSYPYDDVDCLLELIVDTLCSTAATMRIGGTFFQRALSGAIPAA